MFRTLCRIAAAEAVAAANHIGEVNSEIEVEPE